MPSVRRDRTGERYARLVVTGHSHRDKHRNNYWFCRCDCGSTSIVTTGQLTSGGTRSCGCLQREVAAAACVALRTLHGMAGARRTPTYTSWRAARQRCNNPNDPDYDRYGGRGIEMRFGSVLDLVADIGEKPDALSLDRIDNDGHYEPGNVRWATAKQQANNRRAPFVAYAIEHG